MPSSLSTKAVCAAVAIVFFAMRGVCVAEHHDIYLLAGQSNMDGRGHTSELTEEQKSPIEEAIIFYRNVPHSSDGWQTLAPGFSIPPKYKGEIPSPTFGPEIGFARSMLKTDPAQKLALIKGSKGGSSLRVDWKPGVQGDSDSQGPRYRDFIETIRMATKQLSDRGDQFTIRGMLWHQGESDSKSSTGVYQRRLDELIVRIREDVGVPDLPIVVGEVFDNGKRDSVRAAIQLVAAESSTVGLVSSEGTKTWDPGTHFDASSQLLLGERYAAAMSQLPAPAPVADLSASVQHKTNRPNVLFITVDDLNDWVGCLGGNPDAQTPNLDRFAQQSVLFNNAHCQVALCYASRASFMTGMYASKTGIYNNSSKSAHDAYHRAKQMPVWFGDSGYRTMCMGKIYHNDHGKKAYWDEIGPKTLRWGPEPPNGRQFAKRFGKDAQDSLAWAALDIEVGGMPDEQIAAWGIEKLDQEYDQPFFLSLGFYKPHTPMTAPKRYFDQFDRDSLTLPKVLKNDLDDVPEIGRRWVLDRSKLIAEEAVKQYSPSYRRELVHAYHACVALIDDCIGQVLRKLDNSPYADNTIVVLCSDHGWHLGEKNHWRKWMPWEESTRSLLIVRTPDSVGSGNVCQRTVGLIDIYPTLAELCELPPPGGLQGLSFRRLLDNPDGPWDRPALTSTKAGNHTVRSDRWRYIRYVDGSEELYDHDVDPNEWHNLANDPSMNSIKQQHAEWIDRLTQSE
ncbi:sulfatase-like hydrolase/transferase [Rhodopirellula bahusiensis]|uniref:Iduronate-2-sulfatase n=1 Tax=Rhodopirellula bahusiensis TaxID=2014065 RepID=A0A2G1VZB2_9BACT|nr:sulfatase-like hydrolase/transferase [Rhodopirellula bahusiensis]PHQ32124.1 iduronate-2-sulfatase [Rhodopirellula bahusiensis]